MHFRVITRSSNNGFSPSSDTMHISRRSQLSTFIFLLCKNSTLKFISSTSKPWKERGTVQHLESESEVAQSCPALCDTVDCSPPGSSVHGILQARVLEWVAVAFSYIFTSAALKPLLDRLACENTNPIPAVECQTLVGKKMTSDAVSNENTASELREILF